MRSRICTPLFASLLLTMTALLVGCGGGSGLTDEQAHDRLMELWSEGQRLKQEEKFREAEGRYREGITLAGQHESLAVFRPVCIKHLATLAEAEGKYGEALTRLRKARAAYVAAGKSSEAEGLDDWIRELEGKARGG